MSNAAPIQEPNRQPPDHEAGGGDSSGLGRRTLQEQRAAWAKGDQAGFYPYGKTQARVFAEQE